MNQFTDKIAAIKAVRSLPVILESFTDTYGNACFRPKLNIGLKEAKDIVEGIMAIQPQDYMVQNLKDDIARLNQALQDMENKYYDLRSAMRKLTDY